MVQRPHSGVTGDVLHVYRLIDHRITLLKVKTGIRCPDRCGVCCDTQTVEATLLECLPLAHEIYRRGEEQEIHARAQEEGGRDGARCVLYRPDHGAAGRGRCSYYRVRPLLCRLFGFSYRTGKTGHPQFCACRISRQESPDAVARAETAPSGLTDLPVFQSSFMRVASLRPEIGYRLLPINTAIGEALEYVYWKRPKGSVTRKKVA